MHIIPSTPQSVLASILSKPELPTIKGPEFKLSGKFQLTVRRHGEIVQQTEWFDNLILDQGLNYLGAMSLLAASSFPNGPCGYAHIGTGMTPASVEQTALEAYSAGVLYSGAGLYFNTGAPDYVATTTQFYPFAQGQLVGDYAEVGVGRTQATGSLFSRARIIDSNGVPSVITLTSIDQLTIAYSLSVTPKVTATIGTVDLEGSTYSYSAYMMFLTNLGNNAINLKLPNPSLTVPFMGVGYVNGTTQATCYGAGTPLSPTVLTDALVPNATSAIDVNGPATNNMTYSYTNGSYTANSTLTIAPTQGNAVGGIQSILVRFYYSDIGSSFRVLYHFASVVPKTAVKVLRLGLTVSWSR